MITQEQAQQLLKGYQAQDASPVAPQPTEGGNPTISRDVAKQLLAKYEAGQTGAAQQAAAQASPETEESKLPWATQKMLKVPGMRLPLGALQGLSNTLSKMVESGLIDAATASRWAGSHTHLSALSKASPYLDAAADKMQQRREQQVQLAGPLATVGRFGGDVGAYLLGGEATGLGEVGAHLARATEEAPILAKGLTRGMKAIGAGALFGATQEPRKQLGGAIIGAATAPIAEITGEALGKAVGIPSMLKSKASEAISRATERELPEDVAKPALTKTLDTRESALRQQLSNLPAKIQKNLSLGDLIGDEELSKLYHDTLGSVPFSGVQNKNIRLREDILNEGNKAYKYFKGKSSPETINDDLQKDIAGIYKDTTDKNRSNYEKLDGMIKEQDFKVSSDKLSPIRDYIKGLSEEAEKSREAGRLPKTPSDVLADKDLMNMQKFGEKGESYSNLIDQIREVNKRASKQASLTDPSAPYRKKIFTDLQTKMHDIADSEAKRALDAGLIDKNLYNQSVEAAEHHKNVIIPMRQLGIKDVATKGKGIDTLSTKWLKSENKKVFDQLPQETKNKLIFQRLAKNTKEDAQGNLEPTSFTKFANNYKRLPERIKDQLPEKIKATANNVESLAPIASRAFSQISPPKTGVRVAKAGMKYGPPAVAAALGYGAGGVGGGALAGLAGEALTAASAKRAANYLTSPELKEAYLKGALPVSRRDELKAISGKILEKTPKVAALGYLAERGD